MSGAFDFLGGSEGKVSACSAGDPGSIPGSGRCPGEGIGNPLQYLPGESHGQRNLVGYSPWGHKKSDMTERLSTINAYSCVLNCSSVSNSLQPRGQPTRLLCRWDSPGKNTQIRNLLDYLHLTPSREKTKCISDPFTFPNWPYFWLYLMLSLNYDHKEAKLFISV